jgi:hypothetical protein
MFVAAFAVLTFAVVASAIVFIVRCIEETERVIEWRLAGNTVIDIQGSAAQ